MYESMMDSFRKAAESTLQVQQDMFRTWAEYLNPAAARHDQPASAAAEVADQVAAARKRWQETITGMLDQHRASLDQQYREGIKAIDQAFKAADARDPEQLRKLVEELWRHGFDSLGTLVNAQTKDFQKAMEKWSDAAGKAFTPPRH
jgi:NAD(P)-dependent dehydrogenase (short-subunit alcohol dehydrogenase family)